MSIAFFTLCAYITIASATSLMQPACIYPPPFTTTTTTPAPEEKCPGPNEIMVECPDPCPLSCENLETHDRFRCLRPCVRKGCACIDGYVRDANFKCIPRDQCPPKLSCKENEVVDPCPRVCPPEANCNQYLTNIQYMCAQMLPNAPCVPACRCSPGFYRNSKGVCIKPENCCDDPNAEVVDGASSCIPTCQDPNPVNCADSFKIRDCRCKKGYIMHNDKCILIQDCPTQCKKHEVWNPCPGYCTFDDNCGSVVFGAIPDCAAPPPNWKCTGRCECKRGLVRIDDKCESVEKCCTDPNEETTDCPAPCDAKCNGIPNSDCQLMPCFKKGCRCRSGFVRDTNGKCIDTKMCPPMPVCRYDEVLNKCPGYCTFEDDCESVVYGMVRDCMRAAPDWVCEPRCECRKGLVRLNGKCEPVDKCCTGQNEEATDCPAPCDNTCDGKAAPDCQLDRCYNKGCHCKKGFVRNADNVCVDPKECPPKCTKKNEVFNTCGGCDPSCDNLNPICTKMCRIGCFCKPGLVRDSNGDCIDPKECPPKCTKKNEVFNTCGGCDPSCDNLNPICTKMCRIGCFCKPGLVRDSNGDCIDPKECPPKCTKKNEVYTTCGGCDPSCDNLNPICTAVCRTGCFCQSGLVRDANGDCIDPKECPNRTCPGPNEVFVDCKDPCPETCDSIFQVGPKPQCLPRFPCPSGCNCITGYVRNKNNKCVKKEECPPPLICKNNEVLNLCPKSCQPGDMSYCYEYIKNQPNECVPTPKFPCIPRCDCVEGYLRNNNGICVKKEDCCEDPNEIVVDCPDPCPLTCDNLDTHDKFPCARMCLIRGCTCRTGYARDGNFKCIPISKCPSVTTPAPTKPPTKPTPPPTKPTPPPTKPTPPPTKPTYCSTKPTPAPTKPTPPPTKPTPPPTKATYCPTKPTPAPTKPTPPPTQPTPAKTKPTPLPTKPCDPIVTKQPKPITCLPPVILPYPNKIRPMPMPCIEPLARPQLQ